MSGNWVEEDDLSCFLLEGEAEIFRAAMMNYGVENTALYGGGGVNTPTLAAGGGDGFFSPNYPGQLLPNPNSSFSQNQTNENMMCPNYTTNPNSVGAEQLGGVGQSEPPTENAEDVLPADKKQRITKEKALRLEASFRDKNKLEPNQKDQLAEELGLDPRQVVIWFQNRRARTKRKELEADYYTLKDKYSSLKVNYDCLFIETQLLRDKASMLHKLRNEKRSNPDFGNGSSSSVAGNGFLVAAPPRFPPQEEDPFKGLKPPSMGPVFEFGQTGEDVFNSGFGESFNFMVPAMDDQSTFWFPDLGF